MVTKVRKTKNFHVIIEITNGILTHQYEYDLDGEQVGDHDFWTGNDVKIESGKRALGEWLSDSWGVFPHEGLNIKLISCVREDGEDKTNWGR